MATSVRNAANISNSKLDTPEHERQRLISQTSDVSTASTQGAEPNKTAKRLPPIKAPVGLAKGPDLRNCKSKVGSLQNIKHNPVSSGVVIPSQKLQWNAKSKVGSLDNKEHKPGGGKLRIESKKLDWNTSSKVASLENVKHKPGGGNVKIFNECYVVPIKRDLKANASDQVEKVTNEQSASKEASATPKVSKNSSASSNSATTNTKNQASRSLVRNMNNLNLMD